MGRMPAQEPDTCLTPVWNDILNLPMFLPISEGGCKEAGDYFKTTLRKYFLAHNIRAIAWADLSLNPRYPPAR